MNHIINYRRDIDVLRAVSIILVVLFHSFENLFSSGYLGVDVFFVISGFLITNILVRKFNSDSPTDYFLSFWKARIRRLFPSLLFVLSITLCLSIIFLFEHELLSISAHSTASLVYWQNFNLISEIGYFDKEAIRKPLLHLWSLSVEEHFYVFWPIILYLSLACNTELRYTRALLAIIFLSSFSFAIYQYQNDPQAGFYNSFSRFWELSVGAFIALYKSKSNDQKYCYIYLFLLCTLLLVPSYLLQDNLHQFLVTIITALIIKTGFSIPAAMRIEYLGKISYPLYLFHWPIFSFGFLLFGIDSAQPVQMIGLIGLAIICSIFTFEYIERLRFSPFGLKICFIWFGFLLALSIVISSSHFSKLRPFASFINEQTLELKRAEARDENCEQFIGNVKFNYCRANFVGLEKTVALIGDSHAHALYPGLAKVAQEYGYNTILMANSSCPTLIDFQWHNKKTSIETCQMKIKQIVEVINKTPSIKKVIMTDPPPVK